MNRVLLGLLVAAVTFASNNLVADNPEMTLNGTARSGYDAQYFSLRIDVITECANTRALARGATSQKSDAIVNKILSVPNLLPANREQWNEYQALRPSRQSTIFKRSSGRSDSRPCLNKFASRRTLVLKSRALDKIEDVLDKIDEIPETRVTIASDQRDQLTYVNTGDPDLRLEADTEEAAMRTLEARAITNARARYARIQNMCGFGNPEIVRVSVQESRPRYESVYRSNSLAVRGGGSVVRTRDLDPERIFLSQTVTVTFRHTAGRLQCRPILQRGNEQND